DRPQRVSIGSLRSILAALGYACESRNDIAESRARLRALSDGNRAVMLADAPSRCVTFGDIAPAEKLYGLAVQLYSLRQADEGFGTTAALRDLAVTAAREGADAIALSPTHSLFAADPAHYGPYSPSSRLFLNPLYADPATVLGAERVAALREDVRTAQAELIDWPNSAAATYALLRRLFNDFVATDLAQKTPLASNFESFVNEGGDRLHEHALFEALHQHWLGVDQAKWNWREWPAEWRAPDAPAARAFAQREGREIRFHMFAQWLAARSFAGLQQTAREAGMRIGLISDLAVGMSPGGSHAWSRQQDLLPGLSIGAPPDLINARGQDWGLTGFSPQALIKTGFEPFIATLRAALRHAGGVRIDHVMGLSRLWLVPHGASPTEGAYLSYPLDDMLRLIALESHRHRAIVIGEDLGTVQPEFRARLARAGIAGMDVLWFQRDGDAFMPPAEWRRDAVAMTTTHDLPTVAGWWTGVDIATRGAIGLADEKTETPQRAQDRAALWSAFQDAGAASGEPPQEPALALDAAIAFTAQSPAALALIPLEDVLGVTEQPNLPGTIDEHPNWRRRLAKPASELLAAPAVQRRLKILRERQ
ncbi:MAG TPA: 4-alpha-glucanotransferase, partial [Xanthobacteraceae bacterium]|nr:4-alpha-glucanotransferase [Xanthobacteraceae bacterium]